MDGGCRFHLCSTEQELGYQGHHAATLLEILCGGHIYISLTFTLPYMYRTCMHYSFSVELRVVGHANEVDAPVAVSLASR